MKREKLNIAHSELFKCLWMPVREPDKLINFVGETRQFKRMYISRSHEVALLKAYTILVQGAISQPCHREFKSIVINSRRVS